MIYYIRKVLIVTPIFFLAAIIVNEIIQSKRQLSRKFNIINVLFIGYCLSVLFILFFLNGMEFHLGGSVNLIPYYTFYNVYLQADRGVLIPYILNIILFMPCGFLLPFIFPRLTSGKRIILTMLPVILLIEGLQLFIGRALDIDDVINNLLGILIGHAIFHVSVPRFGLIKNRVFSSLKGRLFYLFISLSIAFLPLLGFIVYDHLVEFSPMDTDIFYLPENVSISCELPEGETAMVYQIVNQSDSKSELSQLRQRFNLTGEIIDITSNQYYMVSGKESGYTLYYYYNNTNWKLDNDEYSCQGSNTDIPADNECLTIASSFLEKYDFNLGELEFEKFKEVMNVDDTNKEYTEVKELIYHYRDTSSLKAVGNLVIGIGNNGIVCYIEDSTCWYSEYKEVPIIDSDKALQKIINGRKCDKNLVCAEVTSVTLDYKRESYKGHDRPVWRFNVTALYDYNHDGKLTEKKITIYIDAMG